MSSFHSSCDELRLLGLMRIASNRCCGRSWKSIESDLKADWEVLRASDSFRWHEIADRLRSYCEHYGLLKEPVAGPSSGQSELDSGPLGFSPGGR